MQKNCAEFGRPSGVQKLIIIKSKGSKDANMHREGSLGSLIDATIYGVVWEPICRRYRSLINVAIYGVVCTL